MLWLVLFLIVMAIFFVVLPLYLEKKNRLIKTTVATRREFVQLEEIRLLVWNTAKSRNESFSHYMNSISGEFDLILMQEAVFSTSAAQSILQFNGFEQCGVSGFGERLRDLDYGLLSLSRVSSIKHSFIQSQVAEPIVNTNKYTLLTYYPIDKSDKMLMVVNLHVVNFVRIEAYKHELNRSLQVLSGHLGPIILAGDFNTWSSARTHYLINTIKQFGLTQVSIASKHRRSRWGTVVDYVFVKDLVVKKVNPMKMLSFSDHIPLNIVVALQ